MDRTNEKYKTREGYTIEIIKYINARNSTIRFDDGQVLSNVLFSHIKAGDIKNYNHPSVFGIGYFGIGKYKGSENGKKAKSYSTFTGMIERCYCPKSLKRYPSYIGCYVHPTWHSFQNFAKWFEDNYVEGYHLDKDILLKGNKIYSPDNCCFVPPEINTILTKTDKKRGLLPIGVSAINNRFRSHISQNKKRIHLGTFDNPNDAFNIYKKSKEVAIKKVANKYRSVITNEVYKSLYNYEVHITD